MIKHGELRQIFKDYQRWDVEGRPKHGWDYDNKRPGQYYYDPYHNHISPNDDGTYRFDIQADDSPRGDTWIRGKFALIEGRVSIIEQSAYMS